MKVSKKKIRWLSISDIHLGHLRTYTSFILANLERELLKGKIAELDILFIVGDLFDRLLEFNHPDLPRVFLFINELLNQCSIHGVKVRVLEGTPSHDQKQPRCFEDIWEVGKHTCDFKYVDTLSIEYMEDWDFRILYVPDKIRPTVEEVYEDTLELYKNTGIEKVDLALMHCSFKHQLPPMAKEVFDPDSWLALVKHWILVGHVHFHSIYERIAAQGSFDRLNQGEEGPKGYLMGTVNIGDDPSKDEIYFIENVGAKKYVTIDCTDLSVEESIEKIKGIICTFASDSYIRIRAEKHNPIFSNLRPIMDLDLGNYWSTITNDDLETEEDEKVLKDEEGLEDWIPILITPDNITEIIVNRLLDREIDIKSIEIAKKVIEEII